MGRAARKCDEEEELREGALGGKGGWGWMWKG
jgi:hypothetical protein